jgi:hypothetical protein
MDIKEIIAAINEMQTEGIIGQYAIGGAVGAILHKIEPDTTYDVDVFVNLKPLPGQLLVSLHPILEHLASRGYQLTAAQLCWERYINLVTLPDANGWNNSSSICQTVSGCVRVKVAVLYLNGSNMHKIDYSMFLKNQIFC